MGPRKRNEPVGRSGSAIPARVRRTASETACTASVCPISRLPSSLSIRSSFWVSPSSSRPAGIPVQAPTTSAMSSEPTSSLTIVSLSLEASSASAASSSSRSRPGISPYSSLEAASKSPSRWARSAWPRSSSSRSFSSPTRLRPCFSFSQRALRPRSSSSLSARSRRSFSRRCLEAGSDSFLSASSSMRNRSTERWSSSISSGEESISIRSREAASSTRSMALSGRKREVM
ncbi:hypothetical protein SCALM49S_01216 [Streptomyces californicus]